MKRRVPLIASITLLLIAVVSAGVLSLRNTSASAHQAASLSLNTGHTHAFVANKNGAVHTQAIGSGNLVYHDGPVMSSTTVAYAIYWKPDGATMSENYSSLINRYYSDVGGSALYRNNAQYKDNQNNAPTSSTFGGSWVDTTPYPNGDINDSDIQHSITRAQAANNWTPGLNHLFTVFIGANRNLCAADDFCTSNAGLAGYHKWTEDNTIYAAISYGGSPIGVDSSPNGDMDADGAISMASHEQMEAATDPLVNKSGAWFDDSGYEIGDKCQDTFASFTWNGHPYRVQEEWSNEAQDCVAPQ